METGVSTLLKLLQKELKPKGVNKNALLHLRVEFPASAIISGFLVPTCLEYTFDSDGWKQLFLRNESPGTSQRTFSKYKYYKTGKDRVDYVILEAGIDHMKLKTVQCYEGYINIWVAKVLFLYASI